MAVIRLRSLSIMRLWRWLPLLLMAAAAPFLVFPSGRSAAAAMLLLLAALLGYRVRSFPLPPVVVLLSFSVVGLMAGVGVLVSVNPAVSMNKFWGIVLDVGVFVTVAAGVDAPGRKWAIVAALVAVGVAVAMAALVGTNFPKSKLLDLSAVSHRLPVLIRDVPGSGIPEFGDGNPVNSRNGLFSANEVGGTLAMLLPLPVALVIAYPRGYLWRALLVVPIVVMTGTLVLTQSFSGLVAFGAGLSVLVLWHDRRWGWAALPITLGILIMVAVGGGRLVTHLLESGVSRVEVWQQSLKMLWDMPFTGIGLNTYPFILNRFYPGFATGGNLPHAHNFFLQTALDLGLPGLAAFLTLLAQVGLEVWRNAGRLSAVDRVVLMGATGGLVAYLAFGLTDAITLGAKPSVAWWALLGLVFGVAQRPNGMRTQETLAQ